MASTSPRVKETAIRSCRILRSIPIQIATEIRRYLFLRYIHLELPRDYASYSVLFSSPSTLKPFRIYLRALLILTIFQSLLLAIIYAYAIILEPSIIFGIISLLVFFAVSPSLFKVKIIEDKSKGENTLNDPEKTFMRIVTRNLWLSNVWIWEFFLAIYLILFIRTKDSITKFPSIIFNGFNASSFSELNNHKSINSGFEINILFFILFLVLFLNLLMYDLIINYSLGLNIIFSYPMRIITFSIEFMKTVNKKFIIDTFSGMIIIGILCGSIFTGLFLISKAIEIARAEGFSVYNMYFDYGIAITILVLLALLISALIALMMVLGSLIFIYRIILYSYNVFRDQVRLKALSMIPDKRPKTTSDVIQMLYLFELDWSKVQYLHALLKWMPSGDKPQFLVQEANKIISSNQYNVEVTDALYNLAEIWEDSMEK